MRAILTVPAATATHSQLNSQNVEDLQLIVGFLFVFLTATSTAATATGTVVLGNDGCADTLDFLVLLLHFFCIGLWVGIDPRLAILECIHDLLLLLGFKLFAETLVLTGSFHC